jgi:hypothetical protein
MKNNEHKKDGRGCPREGSGRAPDYRKRSEILAIQLTLGFSESHARRTLREWGDLARVIGNSEFTNT